jgi:hypothetical protein
VSSAASDASQARRTAAEGDGAIVALNESLAGEISRLAAQVDDLSSPLANRRAPDAFASDQDLRSLHLDVDSLSSKFRDLCTSVQLHTDLVVRC